MIRFLPLALSTLLFLRCLHCPAQEARARFPIETTQVAHLLETAGLQVAANDITYSSPMTSSVKTPQLTISAVDIAGESHLRLRITCSGTGECLPFFAAVDLHDPEHASSAKSLLLSKLSTAPPAPPVSASVVHAGERAVLLLEDGQMQIKIPVISIDTGRLGAEVRVASLDRKQTYRAVVAQSGIVRGTLP